MFQVILLVLLGANNGAREIVRERALVVKELRHGLSIGAFLTAKVMVCLLLSAMQAGWMTAFVRWICQFPGDGMAQFFILFLTTLSMSLTCLAVSAFTRTSERASLASIYFVGLQLPLSGAVLALPDAISTFTRPFIAAYWGWSGYLRTMIDSAHYDAVRLTTDTTMATYPLAACVLTLHCCLALGLTAWFISRLMHVDPNEV